MTFHSILFAGNSDSIKKETSQAPDFFPDLNLDQIIDAITAGKEEYNLKPFFYTSLHDPNAITYRHGIMRDLENKVLLEHIISFAQKMRLTREDLAQAAKLNHPSQKDSWFLDALEIYCDTINCLVHQLSLIELQSTGFLGFRDYLTDYSQSGRFTSLLAETKKLKTDLSTVQYCLLIKGDGFKVRKYDSEINYSAMVAATFEKFKQGAGKTYEATFSSWPEMNSVEAKVLDFVALLYPDLFLQLHRYCANNRDYLDPTIGLFDREIQFYVSYLENVARVKRAGLKFCYPRFSDQGKEVYDYEGFDLALAHKLIAENASLVCNDFYLKDQERIFIVSGPNQGGKTTFARAFGQLHYLASIGGLVPGREAELFLFDKLFTHFAREENITNLRGKLEDDLVRIHDILHQITSQSIVIMNESFTSTTLRDAIFLSKKVLAKIIQLDLMQCGMFVPADSFCSNVCNALFTHYKREEDTTMKSGKFDEELSRMSEIVDKLTPNAMVLFSESFAATNDREGSEIARQIVCALLEKRIKVFFVTHLYEFAHDFYDKNPENAIFLRAERQSDGGRTFKIIEGEPLQTSYGEDLYNRIFI